MMSSSSDNLPAALAALQLTRSDKPLNSRNLPGSAGVLAVAVDLLNAFLVRLNQLEQDSDTRLIGLRAAVTIERNNGVEATVQAAATILSHILEKMFPGYEHDQAVVLLKTVHEKLLGDEGDVRSMSLNDTHSAIFSSELTVEQKQQLREIIAPLAKVYQILIRSIPGRDRVNSIVEDAAAAGNPQQLAENLGLKFREWTKGVDAYINFIDCFIETKTIEEGLVLFLRSKEAVEAKIATAEIATADFCQTTNLAKLFRQTKLGLDEVFNAKWLELGLRMGGWRSS